MASKSFEKYGGVFSGLVRVMLGDIPTAKRADQLSSHGKVSSAVRENIHARYKSHCR